MGHTPAPDRATVIDVVATLPPRKLARVANLPVHQVAQGARCLICDASLAGLSSDGPCGKCGAAVGRSVQGNFLKFAPPAHLAQLIRGVTLLLWGAAVLVVVALLSNVLGFGHDIRTHFLLATFTGGLIVVLGVWNLTAAAANAVDAAWESRGRTRLRLLVTIALAAPIVSLLTATLAGTGKTVADVLVVVLTATGAAGLWESARYLKKLALRIPSLPLASFTQYAGWGLTLSVVISVLAGLVIKWIGTGAEGVEQAPSAFVCAPWLAVVGFGVMALVLLVQYRTHLTNQATFAEQTWAHPKHAATDAT